MTIRISLPAEIEAKLRERAAAEGKDPFALALEAVEEKLGLRISGRPDTAARIAAWERFVAGMRGLTETLPSGQRIDDTREAIYQGRGE